MTTLTDTFVDTAGTALEAHTATGANGGWAWTNTGTAGAADIGAANQLKLALDVNTLYLAIGVGSNDQFAQCTLEHVTVNSFQLAVRASFAAGNPTFYGARSTSGGYQLFKNVAGVFTQLGADAGTAAIADVVKLQAVGTTISVVVNGSTIISQVDAAISSGVPGLQVRNGDGAPLDPWVQNFTADAVGGGGGGGGPAAAIMIDCSW
jgi:hypothetical protein